MKPLRLLLVILTATTLLAQARLDSNQMRNDLFAAMDGKDSREMIRYSTVRAWARDILSLAIISLLVVAAFFLMGGGLRAPRIVSAILEALAGFFPIAFCIGGLSWLVMPSLARRIGDWHALARWPLYLATMTVAAPPFAVQSVVENALKHVGSRRPEGVTVTVRATRLGDDFW